MAMMDDSGTGSGSDSTVSNANTKKSWHDKIRSNGWEAPKWFAACILLSIAFNLGIGKMYGQTVAMEWASAYMLQWIMAADNMLTFFLIYEFYQVPASLRIIALKWGFAGCVFFQFFLLIAGHEILARVGNRHVGVGVMMILMGTASLYWISGASDAGVESSLASKVPFLARYYRFLPWYARDGSFFVALPVKFGKPVVPTGKANYGSIELCSSGASETRYFATMLVWVVVCQEVVDCLFAIDSSMAISIATPNLFIAFSAVIFALATLRSMFFMLETVAQLFGLLQYAATFLLFFMGGKLCVSTHYEISHQAVCAVVLGTFALSIGAGLLMQVVEACKNRKKCEAEVSQLDSNSFLISQTC